MARPRTTPGVLEYLIAYAASVACFATCVGTVYFGGAALIAHVLLGPLTMAAAVVVVAAYTAICSLPFAIVGIPIVHALSRESASQAAQVRITGAVTVAVVGLGFTLVTGSLLAGLAIGAGTAIATMAGRAAVIPLVRRTGSAEFRPRERLHP